MVFELLVREVLLVRVDNLKNLSRSERTDKVWYLSLQYRVLQWCRFETQRAVRLSRGAASGLLLAPEESTAVHSTPAKKTDQLVSVKRKQKNSRSPLVELSWTDWFDQCELSSRRSYCKRLNIKENQAKVDFTKQVVRKLTDEITIVQLLRHLHHQRESISRGEWDLGGIRDVYLKHRWTLYFLQKD